MSETERCVWIVSSWSRHHSSSSSVSSASFACCSSATTATTGVSEGGATTDVSEDGATTATTSQFSQNETSAAPLQQELHLTSVRMEQVLLPCNNRNNNSFGRHQQPSPLKQQQDGLVQCNPLMNSLLFLGSQNIQNIFLRVLFLQSIFSLQNKRISLG